jgi:hypothetical protein
MNRGRTSIIGLTGLAAAAATVVIGTSASAATQQVGPFTVTDNVTQDATAGTTTVTYTVTPANPVNQVDAGVEGCHVTNQRVIAISHNGKIEPDKDPSTKQKGPLIRWPANSDNKPGTTLTYSYTVRGLFNASTGENFAIKSKNKVYTGLVGGVSCTTTTSRPTPPGGTAPGTPSTPSTPAGHPGVVPGPGPITCVDRRKFTFRLHKFRNARITDVDVFVNGTRKAHKHGTNLRSVSIAKLPQKAFTVKIVSKQNTGSFITSTRKYSGCKKGHPKVTSHHAHAHR